MERDPEVATTATNSTTATASVGSASPVGDDRGYGRVLLTLARRPRLWPGALATARTLVPRRWWARAPFLPLPDRRWLRFRLVTAYGGAGKGGPTADDVVTFIDWRRSFPHNQR